MCNKYDSPAEKWIECRIGIAAKQNNLFGLNSEWAHGCAALGKYFNFYDSSHGKELLKIETERKLSAQFRMHQLQNRNQIVIIHVNEIVISAHLQNQIFLKYPPSHRCWRWRVNTNNHISVWIMCNWQRLTAPTNRRIVVVIQLNSLSSLIDVFVLIGWCLNGNRYNAIVRFSTQVTISKPKNERKTLISTDARRSYFSAHICDKVEKHRNGIRKYLSSVLDKLMWR